MHKQAKRRLPVARLHSFLACVLCKTGVVHGTNRMNNIRLAQLNSYKQERAPLDYSSLIMGQLEIIKSVSSVMDATCVKDSSVVAENPTMLTLLDASSVLTINQHTNAPVRVRKSWKQVLQRHPPKKSVRFKLLDEVFPVGQEGHEGNDSKHRRRPRGSNGSSTTTRKPAEPQHQDSDLRSLCWYSSSDICMFRHRHERALQNILQCPYTSLVRQLLSALYHEEGASFQHISSSKATMALMRNYRIRYSPSVTTSSEDLWGMELQIAQLSSKVLLGQKKSNLHSPKAAAFFAHQLALAQQGYIKSTVETEAKRHTTTLSD